MNLRRYWPLLLALPLVAALAWALRAPARLVEIATVRAAPFVDGFEEEGRTHLRHRYLLAAPVAGTLRRIVLEPGDAVQAGVREMIQTRTELQGTVVDVQELRTEMHSVRERLSSVRIDAALVAGGVAALVFVINLAKDWFHR